jgi:hypothetical protein
MVILADQIKTAGTAQIYSYKMVSVGLAVLLLGRLA